MKTLTDLKVLALDCQATHPDPSKGHLLEIGWGFFTASDPGELDETKVRTFLLEVPNREIPSNISRVTGITPDDLQRGLDRSQVSKLLEEDTRRPATEHEVIATIHFARFERPHLQHLCRSVHRTETIPFQILCTHEIVKRLLPQLPRKGLRAVAGYFGHSVPEMRRSTHHVLATAYIWRHIVLLLDEDHNIRTLDDLLAWLQTASVPTSAHREYPMNAKERLSLPNKPGVYRMLRSNGDLLYVGKASSLKKRVNSYFQKHRHISEHVLEMLTQARSIDFTATTTSLEAALLEIDEIKTLSPPYNIALRDRDRDLIFTSRDFRSVAEIAGKGHWLGPIPRSVIEPVSQIVALAENGKRATGECIDGWQIHVSSENFPEVDCLQLGWELFKGRYARELSRPSNSLLKLGARLWLSRRVEDAEIAKNGDVSEQPKWTPDKICHLLENRLMFAAHWARRVRWFGLLGNSSVVWTPRTDPDRNRVLLVLHSGLVVQRERLLSDAAIPVSPGTGISMKERLKQFDTSVLDRLRVLTTELRRIVGGGGDLRVKLSPSSTLEPQKLAGLLQWV